MTLVKKDPESPAWKESVLEAIPRLNYNILVELALYMAYEAKCNDKQIWQGIEDAALAGLHHMNITQISQLEWATMEQKPKQVSARLNTLLQKRANESLETATVEQLCEILQGFRQRKNKDLYQKMRKVLITRKNALFPQAVEASAEEKKRAESIVNLLYSFASNRPTNFGVYRVYAAEELNELLSHYEDELKTIAETQGLLDGEHLTRLAQALYILKTNDYESVFRRIEGSAVNLHEARKLDIYHVTNILRAFSHA
jgi:hypothetical protein